MDFLCCKKCRSRLQEMQVSSAKYAGLASCALEAVQEMQVSFLDPVIDSVAPMVPVGEILSRADVEELCEFLRDHDG